MLFMIFSSSSGCSAGEYWDVEEGEDLGSGGPAGECVSCAVAKYRDETHHRETECKNCSGKEKRHGTLIQLDEIIVYLLFSQMVSMNSQKFCKRDI